VDSDGDPTELMLEIIFATDETQGFVDGSTVPISATIGTKTVSPLTFDVIPNVRKTTKVQLRHLSS